MSKNYNWEKNKGFDIKRGQYFVKRFNWISLFLGFALLCLTFMSITVAANESIPRVTVGYFYMKGYQMASEEDSIFRGSGYGMDFLQTLRRYANLNFNYTGYDKAVEDMAEMLKRGEIDLYTLALKEDNFSDEFAYSQPIGRLYTEITVRADDDRYQSGEYAGFNNMIIGTIGEPSFEKELSGFAREKGFEYELVRYSTEEEMSKALKEGEIDGILYSNLRKRKEERRVARFSPKDYFVAVRKEDKELLNEINYGIQQMNTNEGDWQSKFFERYFGDTSFENGELYFTQREKEYIADVQSGKKTITACAQIDRDPYSYPENGEMKGIIPEYFDYLMNMAGLPYTVKIAKNREEHQQWTMNNTVDVYMDMRDTGSIIMDDWIGVQSEPYLQMTTSRVTKRDFSGAIQTVAVTGSQGIKGIEDNIIAKDAKTIVCDTREEAMQAVKDGKADACYVYTYMAEKFINSDPFGDLVSHIMNNPVNDLKFYISPSTDHELISILNKCLKADDSHTLEELIEKYTKFEQTDITLLQFTQQNPVVLILTILLFVLVSGGLALQTMQAKKMEKINKKLEHAVEKEQRANAAKTLFLKNMSHDIRTPMNAIVGFTDIALKNEKNPENKNYLEKIQKSSEHLLMLINDILDVSRVGSGKVKLNLAPTDIRKVEDMVLDIVKGELVNRKLQLNVDRAATESLYVMADALRIREILLNIFSNAVKFTKDGGIINFKVKYNKGTDENHIMVCYEISDNGIGMSEEYLSCIFEEFSQEESDARTLYKGTGLGMTIAKQYVDMMEGTIEVESRKGFGSTFTVKLPLELTEEVETKETEVAEKENDLTGVKVLLVEDNDLNAEIVTEMLEDFGINITRAIDGQDAVECFNNNPPHYFDIIFMDIMMPRMDGYEAAKAIRNLNNRLDGQTIPIIAMTANAFAEDIKKSLEAGMNEHLSKPVMIDEVIQAINRHLELNNYERD